MAHPFFTAEPTTWSSPEAMRPGTVPQLLADLGGRARRAFGAEPVLVDLSLPGVPRVALRVVAPGAEVFALDRHRVGHRVSQWLGR